MKNEYETFVEQFEGKRPIVKPGRRRTINLKDVASRVWHNKICWWDTVNAIMKTRVIPKESNSLDS
jgi:hypothetical protein